MYVATEDQGLWYTDNRRSALPTFIQLSGYPFRFPSRVFFNPFDANEIWVTSFGNGMRLGRVSEPKPVLLGILKTGVTTLINVAAAPGQRIVLSASPDLNAWSPAATNIMFTGQVEFEDRSSNAVRFYRAGVN